MIVAERGRPATRHLPPVWEFTDEWYDFRSNPRGAARILLRADESSYEGGRMGGDHPPAWCREQGRGRVFCTALGHAADAYADPDFLAHLRGGIGWAARLTEGAGLNPHLFGLPSTPVRQAGPVPRG